MSWACMAANGTGSMVCIDDVTADRNIKMNSQGYRAIVSADIQPNATKLMDDRWIMPPNILKKQLKAF